MNILTSRFTAVLVVAALALASLVMYAQALGFHYPCVRCIPFGHIVP